MKIRIVHIFAPNVKRRFGGSSVRWKSIFKRWNDDSVTHLILDFDQGDLVEANEFFSFEYSDQQKNASPIERASWIIPLFRNLVKYKNYYDIVHVHVLWWGGLLLGPWAALQRIPALYESVLLDSDTPTAIKKESLGKFKISCLKRFKRIITISDYLREDFLRCGFRNEQIFTLMNPVDEDVFRPIISNDEKMDLRRELSLPENTRIIIFVGSVKERKGVHDLVQAFVVASQTHPELYLLIVGPQKNSENPSIDERYVRHLHNVLEQKSLSDHVKFTGFIQDKRLISKYYRTSDLFVFPSQNEGMPNVILEAMASRLPVIVTQLPVLNNVIKHFENGLLVPLYSPSKIVSFISLLIKNDLLKKQLGDNALTTVRTNHTYKKWQESLVSFYTKILYKDPIN